MTRRGDLIKRLLKRLALLALVAAGAAAALAWPRINQVETGKTPEYPELQPKTYAASIPQVAKAVKAALNTLPRWKLVGEGTGPAGAEVQALYTTPLRTEHDVMIRIRQDKGRTQVSVRSKSRSFDWDFGQNARNIRGFFAELDRRL
jgi:hypothetical protein